MNRSAKVVSLCRLSFSIGIRSDKKKAVGFIVVLLLYFYRCTSVVLLLFISVSAQAEKIPGDINGDGQVNFADFLLLSKNFGRTDGAVYDPNAEPDTIRIVEQIHVQPEKMLSDIRVAVPMENIKLAYEGYFKALQKFIVRNVHFPFDSDIVIEPTEDSGILYHQRNHDGSFAMGVADVETDVHGIEIIRNLNSFVHEYFHVMGQHWRTRDFALQWFEEGVTQAATLYILRALGDELNDKEVRDKWVFNGYSVGGSLRSRLNGDWINKSIPGEPVSGNEFTAWYRQNEFQLITDPRNFININHIAHNLVFVFEQDPEALNMLRYMTPYGPVNWTNNQTLDEYLRGWWLRTPTRWQSHVKKIANRFGYSVGQ